MSTASSSPDDTARAPARGRPVDEAKREAIIDAARHSFFERGFAASSIEQIAADANVSKVTVYNHFGDKRGLLSATVDNECSKLRGLFHIGETPDGSLSERLTTIGAEMTAFLSRPEMVHFDRRIAAETEHDPEIGHAFLNSGPYRMKEAFTAFLESRVRAGELDIADCALAAEQFVSMCKGIGDLERRFGKAVDAQADEARIAGAVEVFLAAYATKG